MTEAENANTTELRCARVYMAAGVDLADLLCAESVWMSCRSKGSVSTLHHQKPAAVRHRGAAKLHLSVT